VKTTIELDEDRLNRVMKLTGLKTRKAVLDFALREAERAAQMRRFLKSLLSDKEYVDAVAVRQGACWRRKDSGVAVRR
jgi:Arc/MetJ family transcription regulator